MTQKRPYTVNPNNKPGPKSKQSSNDSPKQSLKAKTICFVTKETTTAFDQVVKQRGLSKTQAFEAALTMWIASNDEVKV